MTNYNIPGSINVHKHEWVDPPPGSGPLKVCKHCGVRQTETADAIACRRDKYEQSPVNTIDYDPF